MAVIATYNHCGVTPAAQEDEQPGAARLIRGIAQAECPIAPGGLRVHDTTAGLTVAPGCCCWLKDWREWTQIADWSSPYLGNGGPEPRVEHLGPVIRIWPDGGLDGAMPAGTSPIQITVSQLPELIGGAHQKLRDFLDLVEPWALPLAGQAALSLTATLATHFQVS